MSHVGLKSTVNINSTGSTLIGMAEVNPEVVSEDLRLITKTARLYYEHNLSQPEISKKLHISQSRVSRLLKKATQIGIVQTTVISSSAIYAPLEDFLESKFGLSEVIIVDSTELETESNLHSALGLAAANYLDVTLTGGDTIGISSWSSSLLATVNAMRPKLNQVANQVVQVIGGIGESNAQSHAIRLTNRLAEVTGAKALYLAAPGIVETREMQKSLVANSNISEILRLTGNLSLLLVGIGSIEPSKLLKESGFTLKASEKSELVKAGAVGDVCLRYFDTKGKSVNCSVDKKIIGISQEAIFNTPRRLAVAGGNRKFKAIHAALLGGWINVLVTDSKTAQKLANL
jgi:DNA-binding transcriptional regulator LsrR (DeoR family)